MEDYSSLFEDEDFFVEHLLTSPEEEKSKQTRTYLIKDKITKELACYFSM